MDSELSYKYTATQEWDLGVAKLLCKCHLPAHQKRKQTGDQGKPKRQLLCFCIFTHLHLKYFPQFSSFHSCNRVEEEGKRVDWKYKLAYKEQQLWNLAEQWSRGDMIGICKIMSDMEGVNQNWLFAAHCNTGLGASDEAGRWQVENKDEEAALHATEKGNSGTLCQGMLQMLKFHMDSGDNWTSWETGNPFGADKQTKTTSGTGSFWNTKCWSLRK